VRKGARMTDEDAVRGLSKQLQAMGYELWGDPTTRVQHMYSWQLGGAA